MKVCLSEICDLIAGYAFKSKDFGDFDDKVIKISQINFSGVDMTGLQGVDLSNYNVDKLKKFIAHEGDYVLAMTGATIGKLGRIDHGSAYINQRVLLFRPKANTDKDFLYYKLLEYEFSAYIKNHIDSESAQPNISANTIGKYEIDCPGIEQQKAIGQILRLIDDKISVNGHINQNLEKQAQAIFDKVFPNINEGANVVGDYLTPKRGKNLLSKDAIMGSVPVVAGGLEPSTYHNIANTNPPVISISASGANAGFVRLWLEPIWSSDSSFIDSTMTNHVYFWYVLLKKRQQEIYDSQTGSAQPHIYPQHIANMQISDINPKTLVFFTDTVSPLFAEIGKNQRECILLSRIRDTLLPKLMSGDLDVSELDI